MIMYGGLKSCAKPDETMQVGLITHVTDFKMNGRHLFCCIFNRAPLSVGYPLEDGSLV